MKYLDSLSALVVVRLAAACDTAGKKMEQPTEQKQEEAESQLLDYAIFIVRMECILMASQRTRKEL